MTIPIVLQRTPTHEVSPLAYALTRSSLSILLVFGLQSAHALEPLSSANLSQGIELEAIPDEAKTPVQMMSRSTRLGLEDRITRELQRSADSKQWFESQTRRIQVDAKFDLRTGRLIVDLGEEYGPLSTSAEMEDLQKWLENSVWLMLKNATPYPGTDFLYGGKDMYHYFPEEWRPPRPATAGTVSGSEALNAPIVVSGGHGIYYNHQYKDWRAQRDPSNGITEDFVTPSYAA